MQVYNYDQHNKTKTVELIVLLVLLLLVNLISKNLQKTILIIKTIN